MASWIVHLRVADILLGRIKGLNIPLFAIGNIAPDSGIPDETWEHFTPPPEVTHFIPQDRSAYRAGDGRFFREYLRPLRSFPLDAEQFSFCLGYYFHLLTDNIWYQRVGKPTVEGNSQLYERDPARFWERVKKDWYGLDHLYVRQHPNTLFWRVFVNCAYERDDISFLPRSAVNERIRFIQQYYQSDDEEVREMIGGPFIYLTPAEMDLVVEDTAETCANAYRKVWMNGSREGEISALEFLNRRKGI